MTFVSSSISQRLTFPTVVMILGFGIGVASWSSMLHDLPDAFLGWIGLLDMAWYEQQLNEPTIWQALLWTVYLVYFVWFYLLFFKGARAVSEASRAKSALFALLALLGFQGVLLIFIR